MNKLIKTLVMVLLVAGTACTSQAQDEDSKIKVKVTKEVDGKKETFEREYANAREMMADIEFREFAEDENDIDIHFDMDGLHERIIELHEGSGARAFSFSFDDDEFSPRKHMRNFQFGQGGPSAFWFGDEDAVLDLRSFDSEEYEEELEEKMTDMEEKLKNLDEELRRDIMESIEEIEEMSSRLFPRRIKRSSISVEDAGDDFGSRGRVAVKDELEMDDIDFMVMGNQLNLRFRVKDAGELSVKISTEEGKDIYNRYFEKFGGTFSDRINFSNYSDGMYLIEIEKDKKRLTKKIVID